MAPAAETDFTLSLKNMDRLMKALKENGLEMTRDYIRPSQGEQIPSKSL
jgi:hypothetical protein